MHAIEQFDDTRLGRRSAGPAMQAHGLGDLLAHADRGVQRAHRVLVDHGGDAPSDLAQCGVCQLHHVLTGQQDLTIRLAAVEVAHDGESDGALAGAAFADQPVRLAWGNLKRNIAHSVERPGAGLVSDRQAPHVQNMGQRVSLAPGMAKAWRRRSPTSTVPTDTMAMDAQGKMTSQGAISISGCPSLTISPQAGVGGVTPMPR